MAGRSKNGPAGGNTPTPAVKPWKAGDDVMNTVKQLVTKFHPDLVMAVDEIAVVFKEKAGKSGEAVVAGKTSKASKLFGILGEIDYKFVITLGADVWETYSDAERVALLDHHLCACRAEISPQTGEARYFVQIPDVYFYQDEVERHGFWRTTKKKASDDELLNLFGDDPTP